MFDLDKYRESFDVLDIRPYLPKVLPLYWTADGLWGEDTHIFHYRQRVRVLVSGLIYRADQSRWIHVSASLRYSTPEWSDLKMVKELFVGRDRYAYQVFPPVANWVNINPYVLHLWANLAEGDGRILPEFAAGGVL